MKHVWSVLCQKSVIDNDTNLISLIDCLEEGSFTIGMQKTKSTQVVAPINFQLVGFWLIESDKEKLLDLKIDLIDPTNKKIGDFSGTFDIKQGFKRFRTRINVNSMPITEGGRYIFKIMYRTKTSDSFSKVSELPFDIKINYKMPTP